MRIRSPGLPAPPPPSFIVVNQRIESGHGPVFPFSPFSLFRLCVLLGHPPTGHRALEHEGRIVQRELVTFLSSFLPPSFFFEQYPPSRTRHECD